MYLPWCNDRNNNDGDTSLNKTCKNENVLKNYWKHFEGSGMYLPLCNYGNSKDEDIGSYKSCKNESLKNTDTATKTR